MSLIHKVKHGDDVSSVTSVRFCLMSPKEILEQSVAHIYKHTAKGDLTGTLSDPRLSATNKSRNAVTFLTNKLDHGNWGHCELAVPVYHPIYFDKIKTILKVVCPYCSTIRYREGWDLQRLKNRVAHIMNRDKAFTIDTIVNKGSNNKCTLCGNVLPNVVIDKKQILGYAFQYKKLTPGSVGEIQVTESVSCADVHKILSKISDEEVELLGYNSKYSRPEWMIITILPISPPTIRPSMVTDDGKVQDDDLTQSLHNIIKFNNIVKELLERENVNEHDLQSNIKALQLQVAALINNKTKSYDTVGNRMHRPLATLKDRHNGKTGRVRGNIQGKRINGSARTVITADPNLSIREKGIPYEVAMTLTFPETVNRYNYDRLVKNVHNGPHVYPGANELKLPKQTYPINLACLSAEERKSLVIPHGAIVYRHIISGEDIGMSNRQPTLHKMNIMGHHPKILHGKSFRHSVNITEPYAADFDGDEMNFLYPQQKMSAIEIEELALSSKHMITPQSNSPVVGAVQDTVLGICRASSEHVCGYSANERRYLNYRDFMYLANWVTNNSGVYVKPDKNGWSSIDVISMALPNLSLTRNVRMGDKEPVKLAILNGEIIKEPIGKKQAPFDKSTGLLKASRGSLIHTSWLDYGDTVAADMIDDFSRISSQWLMMECHSVGLRDFKLDDASNKHIESLKLDYSRTIEKLVSSLHSGNYTDSVRFELGLGSRGLTINNYEQFEEDITFLMNECRNKCQEYAAKHIMEYDPNTHPGKMYDNRFMAMVNSGSKGKPTNMVQITAILGPQDMKGRRVQDFYNRRPLPLVVKDSFGAEDRGMVFSSYMQGNNLKEYFYHAMAGRLGVISTSISTAETGYGQRKLIKNLENLHLCYDGTTRDAGGLIIEEVYGGDGYDGTRVERQNVSYITMNSVNLIKTYSVTTEELFMIQEQSGIKIDTDQEIEINNYEVEDIVSDWKYLRDIYRSGLPENIPCIINFDRLIDTIQKLLGERGRVPYREKEEILLPSDIRNGIKYLEDSLKLPTTESINRYSLRQFFCILRSKINSRNLIFNKGYTKYAFTDLLESIVSKFYQGLVSPGEAVGPLAAQCIGEPSTQMTLDAFHNTGGKTQVTAGVPRFNEILAASPAASMRTPSIEIHLNMDIMPAKVVSMVKEASKKYNIVLPEDFTNSRSHVDQFLIDMSLKDLDATKELKKSIVKSYLGDRHGSISSIMMKYESIVYEDIIDNTNIYYVINESMAKSDPEISKFYESFSLDEEEITYPCWLLGITLVRNRKYDVPDNIFPIAGMDFKYIQGGYIRGTVSSAMADMTDLEKIEEQFRKTKVSGIQGIKKTSLREEKTDIVLTDNTIVQKNTKEHTELSEIILSGREYIIDTLGTNLLEVLAQDNVNPYMTKSNDITEINDIFGIEAARSCIIREMASVLSESGIDVRHIRLLADSMTCRGFIKKIDRYGTRNGDSGPISLSSFEETTNVLCDAAAFGTLDPLNSVSANVMFGNFLKYVGTNAFDVLLDESIIINNTVPEPKEDMKVINTDIEEDDCDLKEFNFSL